MKANDQPDPIFIRANYELFILALVLISLANSVLLLLSLSIPQRNVILLVDLTICLLLIADAFYRLFRVPSKRGFLFRRHGWLVFLGSLPIPFIRLARLLQMGIVYRQLRRKDYEAMGAVVVQQRAQSTLLVVILAGITVLEMGSILILGAELHAPHANIKTASDALWWATVTIATVGYGDQYPVTNQGRLIGLLVIVAGVALFSTLTSFLAQWFLAKGNPRGAEIAAPDDARPTIAELRQRLEEIHASHQQGMADLHAQLAALKSTPGQLPGEAGMPQGPARSDEGTDA